MRLLSAVLEGSVMLTPFSCNRDDMTVLVVFFDEGDQS